MSWEGRLVEVEAYVDHDAVMDSWQRLEAGMGLLAQTHDLLRDLEVGEERRRARFANHLASAEVASAVRRGVERIPGWGPLRLRAAWQTRPRSWPRWSPGPGSTWSPGCPASWSTGTSGTTTCCSARGSRS